MRDYRYYFLDSEHHIRGVEEFKGTDDNEAIAEGQRLSDENDYYPEFEIWEGARLVTIGHHAHLVHYG
jgi:hypothetical protein